MSADADPLAQRTAADATGPIDVALVHLDRLGEAVQRDVPLGTMTTYRVGGRAALFVRITERGQLATVAEAVTASGLGSWSSDAAPICSSPTPGSPGSRSGSRISTTRSTSTSY
jgi:hypothetical protein